MKSMLATLNKMKTLKTPEVKSIAPVKPSEKSVEQV